MGEHVARIAAVRRRLAQRRRKFPPPESNRRDEPLRETWLAGG